MKKAIISVFALFLCVCLLYPGIAPVAYADDLIHADDTVISIPSLDADFADNRVMVVLTREASLDFHTYTASDFADIGCAKVTDLSDATAAIAKSALEQAAAVLTSGGTPSPNAIPANHQMVISNYKQVLCLELNAAGKKNVIAAIKLLSQRDDVIYAGPDYAMTIYSAPSVVPSDPNYSQQWAFNVIDIPQAWDITTGSSNVTVGIIDTGINGSHEDLSGNININLSRDFTGEIPIAPNIVLDPHNWTHGTRVAGIIGACGDNNVGIVGVCWDVSLVSLRAFDATGNGYSSKVAMAIDYASDVGIDILNLSAGWDGNGLSDYDYALQSTIANYPGLFVCAAGNDGYDNDTIDNWPCNYRLSNLISVGASDQTDERWVGVNLASNYGKTTVDLFAPGVNVITTYKSTYSVEKGTSFATPYVAGVAALMLSANPNLTSNQLKSLILGAVDINSSLEDLCVTGGRLNAYYAVSFADDLLGE